MKTLAITILILIISFSDCLSQSWKEAENLRNNKLSQCQYDSALYYAEEATALLRGNLGENNPDYADMLCGLSVSHFYLGNYTKARYYSLKEVELRKSLKTTKDKKYIKALENAAIITNRLGLYEDALTLIKKAEKEALNCYSSEKPEYADIIHIMASIFNDMGASKNDRVYLKKAEEFFIKADEVYNKTNENLMSSKIAIKLNHAAYYNNIGNTPLSENLFLEVISLCKSSYGNTHPYYASALNNLGVLYYNNGNYILAEKYFIEAVNVFRNSSANNSIQAAICINNYGSLFFDLGNYILAEDYLIEAKKIFEKNHLRQHHNYAVLLNNLAIIYLSNDYYADRKNKCPECIINSGKIFLEADSIFEKNCKLPHPDGLVLKLNLGLWLKLIGKEKESLQLVTEQTILSNISAFNPVSIIKKMSMSGTLSLHGNQYGHTAIEPVMIPIKTNITDHFVNQEQMELNSKNQIASTKLIIRILFGKRTKIKKALGPYHPAYAELLEILIPLYRSIGDYNMEEYMTLECVNIFNHNVLQDFSFLSESEKEIYYKVRMPIIHSFIKYGLDRKEKNPAITGELYNFVIQNKGLMLKSSTAMRMAILNSKDQELIKKYAEWISLQKEISALYSIPVEMRAKDVAILENNATLIEKYLVQSSQIFGDYKNGIQTKWTDIKNSLNSNDAAIEFTQFKTNDKEKGFITEYCALILRSDSEYPEMIRLFEEKELENIIGSSENNYTSINNLYGTIENPDTRLYKLIWQPLEKHLSGISNIFMSPSGLLHKISFATICKGKNIFLCDDYHIQTKSSTGNTITSSIFSSDKENLSTLIFGGIQYGDSTDNQGWNYLKGTRDEGNAVKSLLEKDNIMVNYLTDKSATETYLKQNMQDYNILHIATHGFFFPDPSKIETSKVTEFGTIVFRGNSRNLGVNSFANSNNPLMRSGLVFAGANQIWNFEDKNEGDDGVLTALEVSQIDMRNCELVVLSACETGLGDINGSEGVYGLQRAFKMAGSKHIIMSLWQVPDDETVEFMTTFYTNLIKTKDIKLAFSLTQKEMRQKNDPYFWGAFVLIE